MRFKIGVWAAAVVAIAVACEAVSMRAPAYRQKGAETATVEIVEYSDFMCPACATAQDELKKLIERHPGKILVVFKHKPWASHRWAFDAARAAEAAGMQGKFWEFHDWLFKEQDVWSRSDKPTGLFVRQAEAMGLDKNKFVRDMGGPQVGERIERDLADAEAEKVRLTPTFMIGGRRVVGASQLKAYGDQFVREADAR